MYCCCVQCQLPASSWGRSVCASTAASRCWLIHRGAESKLKGSGAIQWHSFMRKKSYFSAANDSSPSVLKLDSSDHSSLPLSLLYTPFLSIFLANDSDQPPLYSIITLEYPKQANREWLNSCEHSNEGFSVKYQIKGQKMRPHENHWLFWKMCAAGHCFATCEVVEGTVIFI